MPTAPAHRPSLAIATLLLGLAVLPLYGQVTQGGDDDGVVGAASKRASPGSAGGASDAVGAPREFALQGPSHDPSEGLSSADSPDSKSGASRGALGQVTAMLPDFNEEIYRKNRLELSLESGWLPINIPFVWDFLVDSAYTKNPLPYTMEPNILSLRWQHGDAKGHTFLRGNWDYTFSFSYTDVARGPETRYLAFDYGIRRNFVQPRWRVVPYFEMRGGAGDINAKGYKVIYGQGQDFTFTYMMAAGARYNFSSRYSISGGLTYMHVSNFYLSEPKIEDYGINVYGPIVGINVSLSKQKRQPSP